MKKILCCLLILCVSLSGFAQKSNLDPAKKTNYYAYTPEGKVFFELSKTKVLIQFSPGMSLTAQQVILKKYAALLPLQKDHLLPSPKVTLADCKPGLNNTDIETMLTALNRETGVVYANPFLVYQDGALQGIMDRVIVKLKKEQDLVKLRERAKLMHFDIEKQYEYDKRTFFISFYYSNNFVLIKKVFWINANRSITKLIYS